MSFDRREFLKSSSLVLAFHLPLTKMALAGDEESWPTHYFEITPQGKFTMTFDKAEMGQGIIQGQATMFCEEADIDPSRVEFKTAPVDKIYGTMGGMQLTGGSTSTMDRWQVLRQAGANVRGLMIKAAARELALEAKTLKTQDGQVVAPSGKSVGYQDLIEIARKLELGDPAPLKSPANFKYIGDKKLHQVDVRDKSTGTNQFGIDFDEIPGMKIAMVERCPTFGGKFKKANLDEVRRLKGVLQVFNISSGVAIVAESYWHAKKARDVLAVDWDLGANSRLNSQEIEERYFKKMNQEPGADVHSEGDVEDAFKHADAVVESEYRLPYLMHSCMEPMNCAARFEGKKLTLWCPTQAPTLVRHAMAELLDCDREDVDVVTTKYLGGGFGRRSTLDYSIETVEIARQSKLPVKLIWTREDDTRHSPMRPLNVSRIKAALKGGKVTAWKHQLGCESIMQQVMPGWVPLMLPGWTPGFVGSALSSMARSTMKMMDFAPVTWEGTVSPYQIPNKLIEHYQLGLDVPIHFWRSVGHSYTGFLVESFIDELAHQLNQDSFEFRKSMLPAGSRIRGVLEKVAEVSKWGQPMGEKIGRGIACHESFKSFVAQVADVAIEDSKVRIKKVYCVVDCGVAVNPDMVVKQMESGIIYGLSAVLSGKITLKNGAVEQSNFDDYAPVRMMETPEIEVVIMPSSESPTGVGEPGLPPLAAAVANGLFKINGIRYRRLPIRLG